MCGISAIISHSSSPETTARALAMHSPIAHRGPDGEGILLSDGTRALRFDGAQAVPREIASSAAFAFRRLKIVDLSDAAAQPMSSPDADCWIVFNGEIYNFRSLRAELAGHGHVFRSSGDTEVILAAWSQWGEACFSRLEGMWGILILDLRRKRLVGSRDRFGIKPLYYRLDSDSILFASEIRQILAVSGPPHANRALVSSFLAGDRDTVLEDTFFDEVHAVPPGCRFSIPLNQAIDRLEFVRYWDLAEFKESPTPTDYPAAVSSVGELMHEAVRSHSIADVQVGSLLSGGLDSSTLATLLVRHRRSESHSTPTYSFGFRQTAPQWCELPYVDALVRQEAMENHETSFSPEWVAENAGRVVQALEEPPLAMPAFAQYRTFELCRQHGTTVVFDGQGSDEIFAGYPYHERLLLIDHLRRGRWRPFFNEAGAIARRDSISTPRLLAKAFIEPPLYEAMQRIRGRRAWIHPEYGNRNGADRSRSVNEQLYHDVRWGNAKIILSYADKNAMHFSIESRVPFFDRQLVEYAFSLPAEFKVSRAMRKRVLRDFARTILPSGIPDRRDRIGFATPDAAWIGGPLWPAVREVVRDGSVLGNPCFDRRNAARFIEAYEREEHRDHRAMWRIWMLTVWQRSFSVSM